LSVLIAVLAPYPRINRCHDVKKSGEGPHSGPDSDGAPGRVRCADSSLVAVTTKPRAGRPNYGRFAAG